MFVSSALLALSLVAAPGPDSLASHRAPAATQCLSVERTGTFRVTTQKPGGRDLGLGLIVLENIDGCLEATFITDNANPAVIDGVSMSNGMLKGALRLESGTAKVSLQFDGATVAGSIVQGRNEWTVAGRRTS